MGTGQRHRGRSAGVQHTADKAEEVPVGTREFGASLLLPGLSVAPLNPSSGRLSSHWPVTAAEGGPLL